MHNSQNKYLVLRVPQQLISKQMEPVWCQLHLSFHQVIFQQNRKINIVEKVTEQLLVTSVVLQSSKLLEGRSKHISMRQMLIERFPKNK